MRRVEQSGGQSRSNQSRNQKEQNEIIYMPRFHPGTFRTDPQENPASEVAQQQQRRIPLQMQRLKKGGMHGKKPWASSAHGFRDQMIAA